MENTDTEIAHNFNPILITPQPKVDKPPSGQGLLGGLKDKLQVGKESVSPLSPQEIIAQAEALQQKLFEKAELQTDVVRQSRKLAGDFPPDKTEIQTTVETLKKSLRYKDAPKEEVAKVATDMALRQKAHQIREGIPTKQTTTDDRLTLIKQGRFREALSHDKPAQRILEEDRAKLAEVDKEVFELAGNPKVVEQYRKIQKERSDQLKKTNEAFESQKAARNLSLDTEKMARRAFLKGRQCRASDRTTSPHTDSCTPAQARKPSSKSWPRWSP